MSDVSTAFWVLSSRLSPRENSSSILPTLERKSRQSCSREKERKGRRGLKVLKAEKENEILERKVGKEERKKEVYTLTLYL